MTFGLNHITFSIADVDRSWEFYAKVLGLDPIARWTNGAYFLAGLTWIALNLGSHSSDDGDCTHIAFTVTNEVFGTMAARIEASGARLERKLK